MMKYRMRGVVGGMLLLALTGPSPAFSGSLWTGELAANCSLFTDQKARRVGDIVTVLISEQSSASRTATTTTGRSSKVDDKIEKWFSINGIWNLLRGKDSSTDLADSANLPQLKLSAKHDFEGSGTTLRNDTFTARVSCQVVEILSNQNLVVEGRQSVAVNSEEQIIILRGTVRQQDVTADNMVYSYNIADAKISYMGKGRIGDKQKRGFFEWLGDTIWPF